MPKYFHGSKENHSFLKESIGKIKTVITGWVSTRPFQRQTATKHKDGFSWNQLLLKKRGFVLIAPFKIQFIFNYMQRIIKFRAFNKASGIMYYPEATPGNYNHYLQVGTEGFWLYNKDGQLICTSVNEDVLMQFTGLKDKKDKDIYEGDIIKFHYFYQSLGENLGVQESEHELIGVAKRGAFGWSISAIKGQHWEGYTGYKSGEGESYIVDLYAMNESSIHEESFEVIGNIHDHPHLLTPAKRTA